MNVLFHCLIEMFSNVLDNISSRNGTCESVRQNGLEQEAEDAVCDSVCFGFVYST